MDVSIDSTIVFEHCEDFAAAPIEEAKVLVEQGGSSSGKTYNILIWLISWAYRNENKTILIGRKTWPALRDSAYSDFKEILIKTGLYKIEDHNRTNHDYSLGSCTFQFRSVDDPGKMHGPRRDLTYLNEVNEFTEDDFDQIQMRTRWKTIVDYNPKHFKHWLYDRVIPEKDTVFHKTTYLDNPFLPDSVVSTIEKYKRTNPSKWMVYGLGERAYVEDQIFTNWQEVAEIPENASLEGYGLDFGFVAKAAIVAVYRYDQELYVKQLLYKEGLTNQSLAQAIIDLDIQGHICADIAEPKSIEEIKAYCRSRGFPVRISGVGKGGDSVRASIDLLQGVNINIPKESTDLVEEFYGYLWDRNRAGEMTGKPIKKNDHAIDALRYWALDNLENRNRGKYAYG